MSPRARTVWLRAVLVVTVVVVVAGGLGAVGYVFLKQSSGTAEPPLVAQPTDAPVTLGRIPMTTKIVKVAGQLPKARQAKAQEQIENELTRYVSNGYLGLYPRADFASAYSLLDPELVKYARQDATLVTGERWADLDVSVDPGQLRARVFLLAVNKQAISGTAWITWTFQVTALPPGTASDAPTSTASTSPTTTSTAGAAAIGPKTVTVKGSFYLVKGQKGWQIFGYDVAAPGVPGGKNK